MSLDELEQRLRSLFLASLAGDAGAYRLFLDQLSPRLRGHLRKALSRVGRSDQSEAEDVLQETLLAIHLARHTYEATSPVTAWAHAIARYKLVDHLRRTGRHMAARQLDDDALDLAAPAEHGAVDSRLDLERAMQTLPERTRILIDRVKITGQTIAEAAMAVGMTENAAKVAIHRGLLAMAKMLGARRRKSP